MVLNTTFLDLSFVLSYVLDALCLRRTLSILVKLLCNLFHLDTSLNHYSHGDSVALCMLWTVENSPNCCIIQQ